jgi:exopolysaccharide biosynthesis polyprenyl glycosylphosphotransferase
MLRRYSVNFELFSIVLDIVSICIGLSLAGAANPWMADFFPFVKRSGLHELPRTYYIFFPAIWVYLNLWLDLYNGRRNFRFLDEAFRLLLSTSLASISLAGLLFFASLSIAHSLLVSFILIACWLMALWRMTVRFYWRLQYSNRQELRRVLIVGAGSTGRRIASHFSPPPESNLEIIGFLDDSPEVRAQYEDVLGMTSELEKVLDDYDVNILVIALPAYAFSLAANIVDRLMMYPVKIWIVPNAHRLSLHQCDTVGHISDIPLIDVRAPSISDEQRMIKRLFDLALCSIAIILSAPIMMLIAIFIKLDSPGPIFFRQRRVGENTQPFQMLKFRTMIQDAEKLCSSVETADEHGNIIHKHRDDPRVTRVGRYLRRFSIDELPQLFNVLLGKMSIVGPRPEMPYMVEKYKHWQYARFTIPQGMTGWWQITGRSDKPMHLNTEDDMYYIRNYSIWLDIVIIFKTFAVVIRGKGAF